MSSSNPETTLYMVLGVSESATIGEIQRAYFHQVRQCRPEEDPERYQALNHAREVLISPQRRGEYDQNRKNGARVRVLLDQAALALERDPQKALALLKSAVTLAPEMIRPRVLLTQLLMRTKDYPLAERQFQWLLQRSPQDEQLLCKLARCLLLQSKMSEAEAEIQKVLALNPAYYDAQILLARLYRTQNRIPELVSTLEQAILTDDTENFGDFNLLLQLLLVYIQQGDTTAMEQVAHRLLAVIPSAQAEAAMVAFLRTSEILLQEEHYTWARLLLTLVLPLPLGEDSPLRRQAQEQLRHALLSEETLRVDADTLLIGPLQHCFRVLYRDRSSDNIREDRMSTAFGQLQKEYADNPRRLIQQLDYLRREYALIAQDQAEFLEQLRQRAQHRLQQIQQQATIPATRTMPTESAPDETRRSGLLGRLRGAR